MPTAIIHSATRVIKSLTVDVSPTIPAEHEAVGVPDGFTLGGDFKLDIDNVTKLVPTQEELDAAYTQPLPQILIDLRDAALTLYNSSDTVAKNNALPNDVRQMAQDQKGFLVALREVFKARVSRP